MLKDEMIRDRIVMGIHNKALSERMQYEAGLTLDKAKTMARQKEAIAEQTSQLRGDGSRQSLTVIEQVKQNDVTMPPDQISHYREEASLVAPTVHAVADQSIRKETGVQQRMLHATNVIEKVISVINVFPRLLQPQPMN